MIAENKEYRLKLGDMQSIVSSRVPAVSGNPEITIQRKNSDSIAIEFETEESYIAFKQALDYIGKRTGLNEDLKSDIPDAIKQGDYLIAEEVLKGIRNLVSNAEELYTNGKCLDLALVLERFFPYGDIYYDENHFAFKLHDKFFDITGALTRSEYNMDAAVPLKEYPIYRIQEMLLKK